MIRSLSCLLALVTLAASGATATVEKDLVAVLHSDASVVQKADACQQLRTLGTHQAVPALARLLTHERLSHAARHALEGIPAPEAGAALRDALADSTGNLRLGLLDSLAWRGDATTVPILIPLLHDADPDVARAAASALGRIGGDAATEALESALARPDLPRRLAVAEALLAHAERLHHAGRTDSARGIYQTLSAPSEPDAIREAALAGSIRAAGDDALSQVRSLLESGNPVAQAAALRVAGELRDPRWTMTLAQLLPRSPDAVQVGLLTLLQRSGNAEAVPAIREIARRQAPTVQPAALTALGALADASEVPLLAEFAASSLPAVQSAARDALVSLRHGNVAAALAGQVGNCPPAVEREVFRAMAGRAEPASVPPLLKFGRSPNPTTRALALQTLGNVAEGRNLEALVTLIAEAPDAEQRDEIRGVFETLIERRGVGGTLDPEPLIQGIRSAGQPTREALLAIAVNLPDPRLRTSFRESLRDPALRDPALSALTNTRDPGLVPDLLEVARHPASNSERTRAIAGIARLAGDESVPIPPPDRLGMLNAAWQVAVTTDDKRAVLSSAGQVPDPGALDLASRAAESPELRADAENAILRGAQLLAASHRAPAEMALTRLAEGAVKPEIRDRAQAVLKELRK